MDITRGEVVESDLDRLISKRDEKRRQTEGERLEEELYMESVRRHHEKCQRELAWEWLRFHARQLRNHKLTSRLITAHHEAEIKKYEELLGIDYKGDHAA